MCVTEASQLRRIRLLFRIISNPLQAGVRLHVMKKSLLLSAVTALVVTGCAHQTPLLTSTPKLDNLTQQIVANPENAQAYSNRAYTRALLGDKKGARADVKMSVALKDSGPMHNRAGWAYFNMGDYADALREWETAARMSNLRAHFDYYSLALGYWGMGNTAKALENYQLAVEREPKFGEVKAMQDRTAEWTPRERRAMLEMYTLWSKTWKAQ